MPNEITLFSESYRVPQLSALVTIATVEKNGSENQPYYLTSVCWHHEEEDDVLFKSVTRDEAIQRHEHLCRFFRKYHWFWKPAGDLNT